MSMYHIPNYKRLVMLEMVWECLVTVVYCVGDYDSHIQSCAKPSFTVLHWWWRWQLWQRYQNPNSASQCAYLLSGQSGWWQQWRPSLLNEGSIGYPSLDWSCWQHEVELVEEAVVNFWHDVEKFFTMFVSPAAPKFVLFRKRCNGTPMLKAQAFAVLWSKERWICLLQMRKESL